MRKCTKINANKTHSFSYLLIGFKEPRRMLQLRNRLHIQPLMGVFPLHHKAHYITSDIVY